MENERSMVKSEGPVLSPALEHLAESISRSTIIPQEFRGSPANCLIALEMAHRVNAGVLQVMQSMYIVHGKPSWSGQFIIGAVNASKRFAPLRFEFDKNKTECVAVTEDRDGNELRGPTVSIAMAKAEGWYDRNPKWKNLTELMLMYRAGTFFGRVYCSDILMGMREQYEVMEAEVVKIEEPKIPTPSQTTKDIIADAGGADQEPAPEPQMAQNPTPAPLPPKRAPKKKAKLEVKKPEAPSTAQATKAPSTAQATKAPSTNKVGPNRQALRERLAIGNFTEENFLAVANHNEWLGKGKQWASMDDVHDDMFNVFLAPDEWNVVMEQLEAFPRHVKD